MTNLQVLEKANKEIRKIGGKKPLVVLPLEIWERIQDQLEENDMANSKTYLKKIARARKEKKLYSSKQVKKLLKI